jgi:maltose alpha-D-glucosyltransferase/alpha-amylase
MAKLMDKDQAVATVITQVLARSEEWFASRRWFGDKSRTIAAIRPAVGPTVVSEHGFASLVTAEIAFADGGAATYFVPVLTTTARGDTESERIGRADAAGETWYVADALTVKDFRQWFLRLAASSARFDDATRSWQWRTIGDTAKHLTAASDEPSHLMRGEQSNTSIRYGETVIAKVFRKLQPGLNPDVEIGAFLHARTNFEHVPALLGTTELRDIDVWSIAAIQVFEPNEGDGWAWLLGRMATDGAEPTKSTLEALELLGRRTAELHVALASDDELDAFRPELFQAEMLAGEADTGRRELDVTMDLLSTRLGAESDISAARVRLAEELDAFSLLRGTVRIRVHGDYHLGQVLRTREEDFSILDFEGEPARPIAQRRQKAAALRDVAGMLRSLDYARAYFETQMPPSDPQRQRSREWTESLRDSFLAGYLSRAVHASVPIVPSSREHVARSLRALEVQKALYEVRYELDNRPDWISIPMTALGLVV